MQSLTKSYNRSICETNFKKSPGVKGWKNMIAKIDVNHHVASAWFTLEFKLYIELDLSVAEGLTSTRFQSLHLTYICSGNFYHSILRLRAPA